MSKSKDSKATTKRKHVQLYLTPACWKLLSMYAEVLSARHTRMVFPGRAASGVLSYFLVTHAEEIQSEYYETKRDSLGARLSGLFTPTELSAIRAAAGDATSETEPDR